MTRIKQKVEPTFKATIYMAGDIQTVKNECRKFCYEHGLCVTIKPCDFVYTGGAESGVEVGLINYPRFPVDRLSIRKRAHSLAIHLIEKCSQHTATVVDDEETSWFTRNPDH